MMIMVLSICDGSGGGDDDNGYNGEGDNDPGCDGDGGDV